MKKTCLAQKKIPLEINCIYFKINFTLKMKMKDRPFAFQKYYYYYY